MSPVQNRNGQQIKETDPHRHNCDHLHQLQRNIGRFEPDWALDGRIPWLDPEVGRAGTVHVADSLDDLSEMSTQLARGLLRSHPFLVMGQMTTADPSRSPAGTEAAWAYAHVPAGYPGDATDVVIDEIERYAPGFRERIVARHVTTPAGFEAYNPNYVGGDIGGGANSVPQLVGRPTLSLDPYYTGIPGMYLCSASTPPGAGVHGLSGYHAAKSALRRL